MNFCAACGMPLEDSNFIGKKTGEMDFCIYCVDDQGQVLSCADIFSGGVQFFMEHVSLDRDMAEKITRKNMCKQKYWQGKNEACLQGELASDEQFADVLEKLRNQ